MAKVTDTLKRVIKFEDVMIVDGKLTDDTGDIVTQIIENLPKGVEYFDMQIITAIPAVSEDTGKAEDIEE